MPSKLMSMPSVFRDTLHVLKQTGKRVSVVRDKGRGALLAGKRISNSGKIYWETRKNRTDAANSKL